MSSNVPASSRSVFRSSPYSSLAIPMAATTATTTRVSWPSTPPLPAPVPLTDPNRSSINPPQTMSNTHFNSRYPSIPVPEYQWEDELVVDLLAIPPRLNFLGKFSTISDPKVNNLMRATMFADRVRIQGLPILCVIHIFFFAYFALAFVFIPVNNDLSSFCSSLLFSFLSKFRLG
ncbi:hypothetical protein B0F90DRAFT_1745156 [Multifurca ochricompacta]|uniref:Uncharacterized protein n=1 Tax=Multifurca ochricompacta TaxID=376703 RepID=A0AAD4M202_9AGAM|nr:hypothetical protein B0F90DRAFT_1745156 [Multifurca ochricompacta]